MKGVITRMTAAQRLIEKLQLKEYQAVAVHNPSNMFYITEGYTGEGIVYLSANRTTIITDFRYTEQAENQAPAFGVVMTEVGLSHDQWLANLCAQDGVTELLYEDNWLTVKAYTAMCRTLGNGVQCKSLDLAVEKLREVKTEKEIACIREACRISCQTFDQLLPKIREGMTEKELAIELDFLQLRLGAQGNSFDTIMAFGSNGSLCHAIPGDRKLKRGDMVLMDFGCKVGGYCSDMTRTIAFGEPGEEMRKVYETVRGVQRNAENMVAPGVVCRDVDTYARTAIDEAGYVGRMGHGLGHSLGIDIHENPRFSQTCTELTKPGMVITVEPGIYLPGVGGVRIEDTVLVTEDGFESLVTAPKELIVL